MGTYSEFYVAGSPVLPEKSQANALVMTLFRESDKVIATRRYADRNPIAWGHAIKGANKKRREKVVEYITTVAIAKDRLRVMGFTLKHVEADFEEQKARHVARLRELNDGFDSKSWTEEIALLSASTFTDFLSAMKEILTSGEHYVHFKKRTPPGSALTRYMLDENREDFYWGFPCSDLRCFVRALLEVAPDEAPVTQELTDLVEGEYYAEDARVSELALQELKGSYSINSPVIVLTEGVTDSRAIQQALAILYPHLVGYYSFLDLAVRSPGGAGSLVHVVKSFAGAGIENRVIALFDNDTAGHSARSMLLGVPLPQTMRVLTYPDIELARAYPTIGPNGASIQDVNGSACSIELFFGRDAVTVEGRLLPVQWKAYDERMKRFQGEITNKSLCQSQFDEKVRSARSNSAAIGAQDWEPMRQLLSAMVDAFNS